MEKPILVRCGELYLKGKNQGFFERNLVGNIKSSCSGAKIVKLNKRFLVFGCSVDKLKDVFGLSSVSRVYECDLNLTKMKDLAIRLTKKLNKEKTFKVNTVRGNKDFKLTSMQLNSILGDIIGKRTKAKVNLVRPDFILGVEILDKAYFYTEKISCLGGLPVGTQGRVIAIIEDDASILAAILAMKRGCEIIPVAFRKKDISLLKKFGAKNKLLIAKNIKEAEMAAESFHAIGIVAGQNLNNINKLGKLLVLRPLVGYSNTEIKNKLEFYKQR